MQPKYNACVTHGLGTWFLQPGEIRENGEAQGILKVPHCKNQNLFKIIETTYTLLLIKVIFHIRYSVHAIHMPLRTEAVWYQPLCTAVYFTVCHTCSCRLLHLLVVYLVSRIKKSVRDNHSLCLEKSRRSQGKWILQSSGNHGEISKNSSKNMGPSHQSFL